MPSTPARTRRRPTGTITCARSRCHAGPERTRLTPVAVTTAGTGSITITSNGMASSADPKPLTAWERAARTKMAAAASPIVSWSPRGIRSDQPLPRDGCLELSGEGEQHALLAEVGTELDADRETECVGDHRQRDCRHPRGVEDLGPRGIAARQRVHRPWVARVIRRTPCRARVGRFVYP